MQLSKANPKVVHIDYEEKMTLDKAVEFLDTIVTKLKTEKALTITLGEQSHHVKPSSQVELEVKLEEQGGKHKLELELEWVEGMENQELQIG